MKKIALALAGIIAAGIVVGFTIGKLNSPDYTVEENVLQYIYSRIEMEETAGDIVYSFSCGGRIWSYDAGTDSVETAYSFSLAVQKMPLRKRYKSMNLNMMYSIIGGGPTAIIGGIKFIDYLAPLSKNQRALFAGAAILTTVSGAWWGYRMGYSGDMDCSADAVRKVLNDKTMWRSYAAYRRDHPAP